VDEIVASRIGGQWYNHHYDARGHCILLTTASGVLEQQYDYDAFGYPYAYTATGVKVGLSAVKTRFLFTGREWLNDLRVYDYRNRVYQPELGRFLQPDPIQFKAGDYNLYRYCHNDAINKSDPFGLLEWRFHKSYPNEGPGGRKAIERAITNELKRSQKGREILAADGVATIRPVNKEYPNIITRYSLSDNNFDVYLDPKNSRFQDPAAFRALSKHRGELPEDSDKGRAVIIGHEFAHGIFKALDEHDGGRNIRDNENAIRRDLDLPLRRSDGGTQFRTNE
jgi:RHS repeat-associated protein